MQLIKKLFGRPSEPSTRSPASSQFQDSNDTTEAGSRNARPRELIQVVLRDTMRRHGIPSDWIDCRILSAVSRKSLPGMHVQLLVRSGVDQLLTYVPAFQSSFLDGITRFDPRAQEWLFSLSWQFAAGDSRVTSMPAPGMWNGESRSAPLMVVPAPSAAEAPVAEARRAPAEARRPGCRQASQQPAPVRNNHGAGGALPARAASPEPAQDEELMRDVQALFAIRDAAMRQDPSASCGPAGERDFESTHAGQESASDLPQPPSPGRGW